jgi:hypothetical protein
MLKILPKQREAFGSIAEDLFIKRLVEHFRENYADTVVTLPSGTKSVNISVSEMKEAQLKESLARGVSRARKYEITHESSIAGFIAIMFEAAPNFDEHPVLQQTLSNPEVEANARVGKLLETFTEEILEAVRSRYNVNVWVS